MEANATWEPDTILLPAGVYQLSLVSSVEDQDHWFDPGGGDLDITMSLTIRSTGGQAEWGKGGLFYSAYSPSGTLSVSLTNSLLLNRAGVSSLSSGFAPVPVMDCTLASQHPQDFVQDHGGSLPRIRANAPNIERCTRLRPYRNYLGQGSPVDDPAVANAEPGKVADQGAEEFGALSSFLFTSGFEVGSTIEWSLP